MNCMQIYKYAWVISHLILQQFMNSLELLKLKLLNKKAAPASSNPQPVVEQPQVVITPSPQQYKKEEAAIHEEKPLIVSKEEKVESSPSASDKLSFLKDRLMSRLKTAGTKQQDNQPKTQVAPIEAKNIEVEVKNHPQLVDKVEDNNRVGLIQQSSSIIQKHEQGNIQVLPQKKEEPREMQVEKVEQEEEVVEVAQEQQAEKIQQSIKNDEVQPKEVVMQAEAVEAKVQERAAKEQDQDHMEEQADLGHQIIQNAQQLIQQAQPLQKQEIKDSIQKVQLQKDQQPLADSKERQPQQPIEKNQEEIQRQEVPATEIKLSQVAKVQKLAQVKQPVNKLLLMMANLKKMKAEAEKPKEIEKMEAKQTEQLEQRLDQDKAVSKPTQIVFQENNSRRASELVQEDNNEDGYESQIVQENEEDEDQEQPVGQENLQQNCEVNDDEQEQIQQEIEIEEQPQQPRNLSKKEQKAVKINLKELTRIISKTREVKEILTNKYNMHFPRSENKKGFKQVIQQIKSIIASRAS